jgi:hypothetical protein
LPYCVSPNPFLTDPAVHLGGLQKEIEKSVPPFLGPSVPLVVGPQLIGRIYASHVLSVIGKGFRTSFHLVTAVFLLPLHLNQIRAVIVRNDSEGFGVIPHKYCFTGTFASDSADEIVFSQIAFKEADLLYFYLSFQRH